jgi:lipopolysaccharide transport system permease protein
LVISVTDQNFLSVKPMTQHCNQETSSRNPSANITVYTPESLVRNPIHLLRGMFHDLNAGRELAWRMWVRDISAAYRQTYLGLLWAFISPITGSIVWLFMYFSGIVTFRSTTLSYPIYVLTGTIIWSIFTDSIWSPIGQVNGARGMLARINFPREALVLCGIYHILFNNAIKISILLITLMLLRIYPGWDTLGIHTGWTLIWFPFGILSLILTGTAIGLFFTPLGMLYTDIGRVLGMALQFMMYISPVVFTLESIENTHLAWLSTLYKINPLSPLILTARDWLTGLSPSYLGYFLLINVVSIFFLIISWTVYRIAMPIIIERISA